MSFRSIAGRIYAAYYFMRSRGRIRGRSYILRRPELVRVRAGGRIWIGEGTLVGPGARLVAHDELNIGERCFIGKNATIVAMAPVALGNDVLVAENVSIHSEDHGPPRRREEFSCAPIEIGDWAWLGAGVVVLKGGSVGARTTIGANAVVTRSIPSDVVAVGAPASPIRSVEGHDR